MNDTALTSPPTYPLVVGQGSKIIPLSLIGKRAGGLGSSWVMMEIE